jgi:L-alanine-DL-glutamate epimerase-like enolase superfamily enzyme
MTAARVRLETRRIGGALPSGPAGQRLHAGAERFLAERWSLELALRADASRTANVGEASLGEASLGEASLGEASPLPGYSPDTLEACEAAVADAQRIAEVLLEPALALDAALTTERLRAALAPLSAVPALAFGVETALLNARANRAQTSLCDVLAALSRGARLAVPRGSRAEELRVAALLPQADPEALVLAVEQQLAGGVETFKLKLERDGELNQRRLRALRSRFGAQLRLRLDANQAFSATECGAALRAVAPFNPEFLEEPLAGFALAPATCDEAVFDPRVRLLQSSPVPLALDESLQGAWPSEAFRVVQRSLPLAAIVLKPTTLGGAARCLELARQVAPRGTAAVVTHCFEGPTALRAITALARVVGGPFAHGVAPHGALAAYAASNPGGRP